MKVSEIYICFDKKAFKKKWRLSYGMTIENEKGERTYLLLDRKQYQKIFHQFTFERSNLCTIDGSIYRIYTPKN